MLVAGLAAPADPGLDALLGAGAAQRLRRAVAARARRWAAAVAPGRAWAATSVDAARAALDAAGHQGAVLLVAPDVPGLDRSLVDAVLEDLREGVAVTVGSAHDARPYLIGLAGADDELLRLADRRFEELVAAIHERGGALGLLRSERRLASAADARALALDPMTPTDLAADLAPLARRLREPAQPG